MNLLEVALAYFALVHARRELAVVVLEKVIALFKHSVLVLEFAPGSHLRFDLSQLIFQRRVHAY